MFDKCPDCGSIVLLNDSDVKVFDPTSRQIQGIIQAYCRKCQWGSVWIDDGRTMSVGGKLNRVFLRYVN